MTSTPISGPTKRVDAVATMRSASMSRPESVSSSTAICGLEHRHLQDLDALLLAAGEAVVEVAAGQLAVDLRAAPSFSSSCLRNSGIGIGLSSPSGPPLRCALMACAGSSHGDAGDGVRVLEARGRGPCCERSSGSSSSRSSPLKRTSPLGDLVGRVAHEHVARAWTCRSRSAP